MVPRALLPRPARTITHTAPREIEARERDEAILQRFALSLQRNPGVRTGIWKVTVPRVYEISTTAQDALRSHISIDSLRWCCSNLFGAGVLGSVSPLPRRSTAKDGHPAGDITAINLALTSSTVRSECQALANALLGLHTFNGDVLRTKC